MTDLVYGNLKDADGKPVSGSVTYDGGAISVPAGVACFTVSVPTVAKYAKVNPLTYTLTVGTSSATGTITDVPGNASDDPFYVTSTNQSSHLTMSASMGGSCNRRIMLRVALSEGVLHV